MFFHNESFGLFRVDIGRGDFDCRGVDALGGGKTQESLRKDFENLHILLPEMRFGLRFARGRKGEGVSEMRIQKRRNEILTYNP